MRFTSSKSFVSVRSAAIALALLGAAGTMIGANIRRSTPRQSPIEVVPVDTINERGRPVFRSNLIRVDGVNYRATIQTARYIGGAPREDGGGVNFVETTLTLRRVDGRVMNQNLLPQLVLSQGGVPTQINLVPVLSIRNSRELSWVGPGSVAWADDVQITGQLTIVGRRSTARANVLNTRFDILPLP